MTSLSERIARLTPEQRALYELRLGQQSRHTEGPRIPRRRGPGPWRASVDQTALWFFQQLDPETSAYNIAFGHRLRGRIEPSALRRALGEVVRRHEIFRTTFREEDGRPYQVVAAALETRIPEVDLRGVARREEVARRFGTRWARIAFDLARGPLLRLVLLRFGDREGVLAVVFHHTVIDWWSCHLFDRELYSLYARELTGRGVDLPELPIQFADWSLWRERWLESEACRRQLDYWRRQLADAPRVLEIPGDHPRPPVQTYRGAREYFSLPAELTAAVRAANREHRATSLMTLLSLSFAFLHRHTGEDDLVLGTPASAEREHEETAHLIGYLLNTLVLRADLAGEPSFSDLLKQVKVTVLEAFENKDLPFRYLVESLHPSRDLSRMPIYQAEFLHVGSHSAVHQDRTPFTLDDYGFEVGVFAIDRRTSPVDFQVAFDERAEGISLMVEYSSDLFEPLTVRRMGRHLIELSRSLLADPEKPISQAPWLGAAAWQLLLEWSRGPSAGALEPVTGGELVDHQIRARIRRAPDRVAVCRGPESLSAAELGTRAGALARELGRHGVGPEVTVALDLPRSCVMVTALIAVLEAGGAYVPLDPRHPVARRRWIARDAGVTLVLAGGTQADDWQGHAPVILRLDGERPPTPATPGAAGTFASRARYGLEPAYVIYTSGSTGSPKGVSVSHAALTYFLRAIRERVGLDTSERLLAITTLAFDIAGLEIFLPLVLGLRLVLAREETASDDRLLAEALESHRISALQATPSTWQMLFAGGWRGKKDLKALCGGERLPGALAARLAAGCGALWNLYGPTEATIWASTARLRTGAEVTIGRPLAGTSAWVSDPRLAPAPPGVPGDLYLAGPGLARGYHGRPGLTALRFLPDPLGGRGGERLYDTGDRARWSSRGRLEFLGRQGDQVKVRGHRIEPAEVERALAAHPAVREAAVVGRDGGDGTVELVAYVTGEDDLSALRRHLRSRLPEAMVPTRFVSLAEMPLTPNGKVDRKSLPEPTHPPGRTALESFDHATSREVVLALIWEELLGARPIAPSDDFFELGGHSLLATRLRRAVEERLGYVMPVVQVFRTPTLRALSEALPASPKLRREYNCLVPLKTDGGKPPFFCVHPAGGSAAIYYRLATLFDPERPFFGIQALDDYFDVEPIRARTGLEDLARAYVDGLRRTWPRGPYCLGGWSAGGLIAFEMARQLLEAGDEVGALVLFDTSPPEHRTRSSAQERDEIFKGWVETLNEMVGPRLDAQALVKLPPEERLAALVPAVAELTGGWDRHLTRQYLSGLQETATELARWTRGYEVRHYPGPMALVRPSGSETPPATAHGASPRLSEPDYGWQAFCDQRVALHESAGEHLTMMSPGNVETLAEILVSILG